MAIDHSLPSKQPLRVIIEQADRIVLGLIIVAMAYVIVASFQLGLGTVGRPGPGTWPAMVAALTVVAALIALRVGRDEPEGVSRVGLIRFSAFLIGMLAFFPLYTFTGFLLAGAVSVLIIMRFVYRRSWVITGLVAVLGSAAVYSLFSLALGVPLNA